MSPKTALYGTISTTGGMGRARACLRKLCAGKPQNKETKRCCFILAAGLQLTQTGHLSNHNLDQRRYARRGGRFPPEQVAVFTGIRTEGRPILTTSSRCEWRKETGGSIAVVHIHGVQKEGGSGGLIRPPSWRF